MKNTTQIGLMKTALMTFGATGLFTALYLITGIALPQLPTLFDMLHTWRIVFNAR